MTNSVATQTASPGARAATRSSVRADLRVAVVVRGPVVAKRVRQILASAGVSADNAEVFVSAPPNPHVPVLLIADSIDDIDRELLAGPLECDFLLEPFTEAEIAFRVETLADRHRRRGDRLDRAESLQLRAMDLVGRLHAAEGEELLADAAIEGIADLLAAQAVAMFVFDHDEHSGFARRVSAGSISVLRDHVERQRRIRDAATGLWRKGADLTIDPLDAPDQLAATVRWALGEAVDHAIVFPIATRDQLYGVFVVGDTNDRPRRPRFERALTHYVGMQIAYALSEVHVEAERREAQDALNATMHELQRHIDVSNDLGVIVRSIADAVNVGVLFFDNQKRPTLRNRMVDEMLRLTGFDPATGRSKYVYASDRHTRVKQDKNILTQTLEGDERGLLYWIGEPGGEQRAIITEAHPISRPDGAPLGSAIVTYDVTDLANAIDIREEYLASVSHELRTPLTSIVGYLDLIEDEHDLAALGIEAEFAVMQRNAAQLLALIHDLLSTSTGDFPLRIEPVDLATLLDQSVNAFRPVLEKAGHRFERAGSVPVLLAEVDPGRIKQVIDNVISNAVKYTPAAGTITVTLQEEEGNAVIRVADTGRGMSKSDQRQLFERFFRSRDVREEAIQGVGLGLTIVKMIVDAHHGRIDVDSELQEGTTITIRLPLRSDADVALTSPGEGDTA